MHFMRYVAVISSTGKPLMPCHSARARELVRKRRAVRRFDRGLFYIRLLDRAAGETQEIAVGIDPGSKKEAMTLKSEFHTYLNIQMDAKKGVKRKIETRKIMRRARRQRKAPFRKCRSNRSQLRNKNRIPPSTKARWSWKLQVLIWLCRRYPVKFFIAEDIKACSRKNQRRWNVSFSPLEVGKHWFYSELRKMGHLETYEGWQTKEERDKFGLTKSSSKLSNRWDAHCVDSWVLANKWIGGHTKPDNREMLLMTPLNFYRRQLHKLQPGKNGVRKAYGGTVREGIKKGSWVLHPVVGVAYVGGGTQGRISLYSVETNCKLTRSARPEDCLYLVRSSWRAWMKRYTLQPYFGPASKSCCVTPSSVRPGRQLPA